VPFPGFLLPYIEDAETEPTRQAIITGLEGFATSELKCVLWLVQRLAMGRKQYGVLNPHDGHNWQREGAEEALDLMVYYVAGLMQRGEL